jgi:hypothetical protein
MTMGSAQRIPIAGRLGLCGMLALVLRAAAPRPAPATVRWAAAPVPAPQPRTPAEVALRQAWRYRTRAKIAVNREREEVEQWDPRAAMDLDPETWRRQLMAADPNGDMRRAAAWNRQAMAEARTPAEAYRAAELQVLIERESGRHEAEFRQALGLLALAPESPTARGLLARARKCLLARMGRVSSAARISPSSSDRSSNCAVAAQPAPLPP